MKKYKKYKDSGIEWIGEIPNHWEINRIKFFSNVYSSSVDRHIYKNGIQVLVCHYPVIYNNEFINENSEFSKGSCSRDEFEKYQISEGLVILTKDSESPDDIGIPCYVEEKLNNVVCGYHLTIVDNMDNNINSKFIFRFIQSNRVKGHFEVESKGITRFGLGKSKIENLFINIPPLQEQQQIVSFLDNKTQKIDELVEKTEKKIELLKEKRTALINHCVTKGLSAFLADKPASVEMKDSGVEWIGEIPSHWNKIKLFYATNLITDGEHISPNFVEKGIPFLSAKDVYNGGVDIDVDKFVTVEEANKFRKRCNPEYNDILIVSRGAKIGRVSIVNTNKIFCLLGSVILLKIINSVNNKFIFFLLSSSRILEELILLSGSSAQPAIYLDDLRYLRIPLPPLLEQKQIAKYLDKQTEKIDTIIEKETKRIKLLKEYHKALISEVVTGKVDLSADRQV